MTSTLLNRTTATKENALSDEERDAFLAEKRIGRLATKRTDGWPHVTPIWYAWEDGRFLLTLGKSRRHLRNIAGDPLVTLCVDDDPRIADPTKSPRSVVCFGKASLIEDEPTVREATQKVLGRYLDASGPEFEEIAWFEGRTLVVIEPVRWLAWDQGKG